LASAHSRAGFRRRVSAGWNLRPAAQTGH
jgi:hypothetical protein